MKPLLPTHGVEEKLLDEVVLDDLKKEKEGGRQNLREKTVSVGRKGKRGGQPRCAKTSVFQSPVASVEFWNWDSGQFEEAITCLLTERLLCARNTH